MTQQQQPPEVDLNQQKRQLSTIQEEEPNFDSAKPETEPEQQQTKKRRQCYRYFFRNELLNRVNFVIFKQKVRDKTPMTLEQMRALYDDLPEDKQLTKARLLLRIKRAESSLPQFDLDSKVTNHLKAPSQYVRNQWASVRPLTADDLYVPVDGVTDQRGFIEFCRQHWSNANGEYIIIDDCFERTLYGDVKCRQQNSFNGCDIVEQMDISCEDVPAVDMFNQIRKGRRSSPQKLTLVFGQFRGWVFQQAVDLLELHGVKQQNLNESQPQMLLVLYGHRVIACSQANGSLELLGHTMSILGITVSAGFASRLALKSMLEFCKSLEHPLQLFVDPKSQNDLLTLAFELKFKVDATVRQDGLTKLLLIYR